MIRKRLKISGSMWSANLAELGKSLKLVENYCDSFHFDIMDGHFVKNLLFGPDTIKALRGLTDKAFEIHFMVSNPEEMIEQFIDAGGDIFIFHTQTCNQTLEALQHLKNRGIKVGIALKVEEKCEKILEYLTLVDYVIIMGTEIGIKGVSISPETYKKIDFLKSIIKRNCYNIEIQIDGGIRKETVPKLFKSGADIVTAGSLLFNNDYENIFNWFRSLPISNA